MSRLIIRKRHDRLRRCTRLIILSNPVGFCIYIYIYTRNSTAAMRRSGDTSQCVNQLLLTNRIMCFRIGTCDQSQTDEPNNKVDAGRRFVILSSRKQLNVGSKKKKIMFRKPHIMAARNLTL